MGWQSRHLSPRWFVTNTLCAWGHLSNDWLPIFPTLSGEGYMLQAAGSPEAGTHNKTNLDDEPLQERCPRVRGDLLWDFLQNLDMMQWQCGLQHPHQLQWIRTPSFLNIQCIFMSRIDFMSSSCFTMSGPVVASSGGKGREAQLIGCPTQVTSSRSVIQLDSVKISRIERCNETDR